jgi:peroxiredoxin
MDVRRNSRLEELEQRYSDLEYLLENTPEKEAISVLHAIILESRRRPPSNGEPAHAAHDGRKVTLEDVANLYKSAPGMQGEIENEGLPVGVQAPGFTLPDANGKLVSLSDFKGRTIVLVFYPLDWSPACSDQLSLYQSELDEFEKYNAQVIGISVDSIYSHGAWASVRGITFPLLADFHPKGEVARRYKAMRDTDGFSERALYIIDGDGIIRYRHISPQLHKIPDIYELLGQLKELDAQLEVAPSQSPS